jgi:hypothetical protein
MSNHCHFEHVNPPNSDYQLKKYLHAHSWFCLHMWLLFHRSRILSNPWSEILGSFMFRSQLKSQMETFNYRQMENFTDGKDREIYF